MAAKSDKRVASSVFITLAAPRREEAAAEVRQAVCEVRPGRPREIPAPEKASGAGLVGRPEPWKAPGKVMAAVPAVPSQLSNGGKRARTGWGPGQRQYQRQGDGQALRLVVHSFM